MLEPESLSEFSLERKTLSVRQQLLLEDFEGGTFAEFIKNLQDLALHYPDDTVIEHEYDYDQNKHRYFIVFVRPETDREYAQRLKEEAIMQEERERNHKKSLKAEKALLQRLLKKHGLPVNFQHERV